MSTINEFKTTNGRLARYVWKRIINQYVARHDSLEEPVTTEGYASEINDFLCNRKGMSDDKKNALPKKLKTEFEEACLSDDNLKWIDPNNERLCLWLWNCVKSYSFKSADSQPEEDLDSDELQSFSEVLNPEYLANSSQEQKGYITFGLDGSYNTPKEHYNAIITCLDLWQAPVRLKREFNNEHKKLWEEVVAYGNFSWFVPVKKKEDEDWFFQYINKALAAYIQPERTPWDLSKTMPIAILRFDSWVPDFTREKEFFLKDMRKAWSQKKHRYKMKKDDRKAYSVVMHEGIHDHLEELANSAGLSKNKYLEKLIADEYKNRIYSEKNS